MRKSLFNLTGLLFLLLQKINFNEMDAKIITEKESHLSSCFLTPWEPVVRISYYIWT